MEKLYFINDNKVSKTAFIASLKNSLTTTTTDADGAEYERFDQQRYGELLRKLNRGWTYTIYKPKTKTAPRIYRVYKIITVDAPYNLGLPQTDIKTPPELSDELARSATHKMIMGCDMAIGKDSCVIAPINPKETGGKE